MVEQTNENPALKRLRECVSAMHFMKQSMGFELISQADYDTFKTAMNDKIHTIMTDLLNTIDTG